MFQPVNQDMLIPKKLVVAFEMGASHFGINTLIPEFYLAKKERFRNEEEEQFVKVRRPQRNQSIRHLQ
jgi:hypothetical protein